MSTDDTGAISFRSLTIDTWDQMQQLFGDKGACGGCWCMYWRLQRRDYEANKGLPNKKMLRSLIESGQPLGILGFDHQTPIGWCSVAPRNSLRRLETSRYFKPIKEEKQVWSISCLFIAPAYRHRGLSLQLIEEGCMYARQNGAQIIEAYPIVPVKEKVPEAFAWVGFAKSFSLAGFQMVKQPSKSRLLMRMYLK